MGKYFLKRILWLIPTVLCVGILIFSLMHFVPGDPATQLLGVEATKAEIEAWFDRLGIADRRTTRVAQMSFGQQQRVAFMRALCQPFDFILADEPVSHLDDDNSRIMGELLMEEANRQGAGIIVTSIGHHMDLPYEKTFRL